MKTLLLVLMAAIISGTGHVLIAKGMRAGGDFTEAPARDLGTMAARAVASPWVIAGVGLQALFFFAYVTLLSRADVSQLLPLTTMDQIVVALLAQLVLAEAVTGTRWAGIVFIVIGVVLVSRT